jgi:hypothetical protein
MHKETPKPNEGDNATSVEQPKGFASPPCQRHEIDPAYGGDLSEAESPSEPTKTSKIMPLSVNQ